MRWLFFNSLIQEIHYTAYWRQAHHKFFFVYLKVIRITGLL